MHRHLSPQHNKAMTGILRRLRAALAPRRASSDSLLPAALEAYLAGELQDASEYCATELEKNGRNAEVLALMARIAVDARRLDEASRLAQLAIEANPTAAAGHYAAGRAFQAA